MHKLLKNAPTHIQLNDDAPNTELAKTETTVFSPLPAGLASASAPVCSIQLVPTSTKHDINPQASNHNKDTVHGQGQRGIAQQAASPIAVVVALATGAPLDTRREFRRIVLVLDEALVVRRVRVGDLVVEEARQDEGDGGGAGAADVGEDEGERGDGHGGDEGEDDEDCGHNGEAHVAHFLARLGG
jgi:hypothetical protein